MTGSDTPTGTSREGLASLLRERTCTLRDASQALHMSEREVAEHLEHIERSARVRGERVRVEPSRCLACGFVFEARSRARRPGKCPRCRGTRISQPRFSLEPE